MKFKVFIMTLILLSIPMIASAGCGFIQPADLPLSDVPGFFSGFWHGLIAPYTLIVGIFIKVYMYAIPNSGWGYNLGFLLGFMSSGAIGWIAAFIALFCMI